MGVRVLPGSLAGRGAKEAAQDLDVQPVLEELQAQEQQQEEQQELIAMIVSSSSSSSSSSSGSGSAAAGSEEDEPMAPVEGGLEPVQKKPEGAEGAEDDVLVACNFDIDGGEYVMHKIWTTSGSSSLSTLAIRTTSQVQCKALVR